MRKLISLLFLVTLLFAFVYSASAAIVFSDDFEREELGSDWTVVGGAWAIEEGELNAEGVEWLLSSGQYYEDMSIEVKVKIIDHGGYPWNWIALMARATNPNDDAWASGYVVYLRYDGRIGIFTAQDGQIAETQTGITPDEFVTITASFSGSNILVYVNGVLYIDVTHSRYSAGYFSLKSYVAHAHYDDVLVDNPGNNNGPPDGFVIPEYPLGTVLAVIAMLTALGVYKSKRIRIHL